MGAEAEKQTNKNGTNKQGGKVEEMGKDEFRGITSRLGDVLNSSILARSRSGWAIEKVPRPTWAMAETLTQTELLTD